jgi:hypothetical protein
MATGMFDARAEPAGGDPAGGLAVRIGEFRAGAHRLTAFRLQADAFFRRAGGDDSASAWRRERPAGAQDFGIAQISPALAGSVFSSRSLP